jgi:hypothetical protein
MAKKSQVSNQKEVTVHLHQVAATLSGVVPRIEAAVEQLNDQLAFVDRTDHAIAGERMEYDG